MRSLSCNLNTCMNPSGLFCELHTLLCYTMHVIPWVSLCNTNVLLCVTLCYYVLLCDTMGYCATPQGILCNSVSYFATSQPCIPVPSRFIDHPISPIFHSIPTPQRERNHHKDLQALWTLTLPIQRSSFSWSSDTGVQRSSGSSCWNRIPPHALHTCTLSVPQPQPC